MKTFKEFITESLTNDDLKKILKTELTSWYNTLLDDNDKLGLEKPKKHGGTIQVGDSDYGNISIDSINMNRYRKKIEQNIDLLLKIESVSKRLDNQRESNFLVNTVLRVFEMYTSGKITKDKFAYTLHDAIEITPKIGSISKSKLADSIFTKLKKDHDVEQKKIEKLAGGTDLNAPANDFLTQLFGV